MTSVSHGTMDQFQEVSPLFVVGTGRSGTTLLQMMLNGHPRIAVYGEIHFFDSVCQLRHWVPDISTDDKLNQFFGKLKLIDEFQYLPDLENLLSKVHARMSDSSVRSYELFYLYLMEAFAASRGSVRIGEKTPQNLRFMPDIFSIFPAAKILHIMRDPRAVVSSFRKADWASPDVLSHAIKWKVGILYGQELEDSPDKYLLIRYEDLVQEPRWELERICAFIEEDFVEEMLEYHRSAGTLLGDEPWKQGVEQPVYTTSQDRWRSELTASQIHLIDIITRPLPSQYGYSEIQASSVLRVKSLIRACYELFLYMKYKVKAWLVNFKKGEPLVYGETRRIWSMIFNRHGKKHL